MFPDYYKRLGVNNNTPRGEIKKAYRTLALKYHPDRNRNHNAHDIFIGINEAYSILYDKQAKAKYDIEYRRHKQRQGDYTYESDNPFDNDDLNRKAARAKKKAARYAAMAFIKFSNHLVGVFKSILLLIKNMVLFIAYTLLGIFGVFIMLIGLYSIGNGMYLNWDLFVTLRGVIIFFPGFLLINVADRNKTLLKELYVGLRAFGGLLTLIGLSHLALRLLLNGGSSGISYGIVVSIIGILFWIVSYRKLKAHTDLQSASTTK